MKFQDYKSLGELLECIHPGVTIADNNGNFVYAGKEFLSSTGTREEQIIGKYVEDEEVARMFNPCVSRMVYEQKKKITTTQKAMNGKETFVTGIPIFDEKNELALIICFSSWEMLDYEDLKARFEKVKQDNEKLISEINRLVRRENIERNIISTSRKSEDTVRLLRFFSESKVPSFLYGEEGTGKKFLAHIFYENLGSVCEYNCNLLDQETIENELFGVKEEGILNSGGYKTLILQDIDNLSFKIQKKLIQFMKSQEVIIVGISKFSLEHLKESGKIIKDFYYLFKPYQVQFYSLKERPEDLKAYIEYYLNLYNGKYGRNVYFSPKAMKCLFNYEWKENINEVKYTVERLVLTTEKERIDIFHLPKQISDSSVEFFSEMTSLKEMMDFYEKEIIQEAYEKYKTTVAVAENLGISQASAVRKIQKYIKGNKA